MSSPVQVPNLTANDMLNNIAAEQRASAARAEQVRELSERTKQERSMLQQTVYDNSNPSPIVISILIGGILFVLWSSWIMFLRPSTSGEWRDDMNNVYNLRHNAFTGVVSMKINGQCAGRAKIIDNFVKYGDLNGLWDYQDAIVFIGGLQLYRSA